MESDLGRGSPDSGIKGLMDSPPRLDPQRLRELLRLPEHIPSLDSTYSDRLVRAQEFSEQRKQYFENGLFRVSSSFEYDLNKLAIQRTNLGFKDRLDRSIVSTNLKAAGLSEQVLNLLESATLFYSYQDFLPKEIADLIRGLDPQDQTEAIRKLGLSLERLRTLKILPTIRDFKSPEFRQSLVTVANLPENHILQAIQDLEDYTFLRNNSSPAYRSGDYFELIKVLETGGLSPQQKHKFDQLQLYEGLVGSLPVKNSPEEIYPPHFLSLSQALSYDPENLAEEFLPHVVDLAYYQLRAPNSASEGYRSPVGTQFLEHLQHLQQAGRLAMLNLLRNNGWNCITFYHQLNRYASQLKPIEAIEMIDKVSHLISQPDKFAWVSTVNQALTNMPLDMTQIDSYEAWYAQRELITNVLVCIKALPGDFDLDGLIRISDNGAVKVNDDLVSSIFTKARENAAMSRGQDRIFMTAIDDLIRNFAPRMGVDGRYYLRGSDAIKDGIWSLFGYIASQKDRVEELFTEFGLPTSKLLTEILSLPSPLDDGLVQHLIEQCQDVQEINPSLLYPHLIKTRTSTQAKALTHLPDQFVQTLPPEEQQLIAFIKQVAPPFQEFVIGKRDQFSSLVVNGHPTEQLLVELTTSGNYLHSITELLTDEMLVNLTPDQLQFWQTIRSLPTVGRQALINHRSRFEEYYQDSKPTPAFLNLMVAITRGQQDMDEILKLVDLDTLAPDQRDYWLFFKSSAMQLRAFLAENREDFATYFNEGKPTIEFLNKVADNTPSLVTYGIRNIDRDTLSTEELAFWTFYERCSYPAMRGFLLNKKAHFAEYVVDGQETSLYYQTLGQIDSYSFIRIATKDIWKKAFGEEVIEELLAALPRRNDERRNAFTHNEYDRTTQLINFFLNSRQEIFQLTNQDLGVLARFVQEFGLARDPVLFHYFKALSLYEGGQVSELPDDIASSGVGTLEDLKTQLKYLKERVYSAEPITNLSTLTSFETQILGFITGKTNHRFDMGRPTIDQIIYTFNEQITSGEIAPLPNGYQTETLDISRVRIEFNTEAIRADFEVLQSEILASIDNPQDIEGLKASLGSALNNKIKEIEANRQGSEGRKHEALSGQIARFEGYLDSLTNIRDLDQLMVALLEMNFDKTEQRVVNSLFRKIIFGKIFTHHFSPGFVQEIQTQLQEGLSASSIETVLNIVDEMAKTHVLNLQSNKEGYWQDETFDKIKTTRRGKDLPHCFSPHANKLREEVDKFQKIQTGNNAQIRIIPDRGFVGEMSGYLADVCYTAEYPLLSRYPNLIPYKFIIPNVETGEPEFIGSVLVFEIEDSQGLPSLLIRAFDVPNESVVDINQFIEGFIDKLSSVGQKRGKQRILVPGNGGAISNYQMTINHMHRNYIHNRPKVSLKERFAFNGYDLTEDCYEARNLQAA